MATKKGNTVTTNKWYWKHLTTVERLVSRSLYRGHKDKYLRLLRQYVRKSQELHDTEEPSERKKLMEQLVKIEKRCDGPL